MRIWRSSATRRESRRDRGFTLLEVLVAFAVLALSLAVLLRVFSDGLAAIDRSERYATATLLARSTLEQTGSSIPLVPGELSRDAGDGFTVRLRITPSATALPVPVTNGLIVPYEVAAYVEWRGGSVTLATLRLGEEGAVSTPFESNSGATGQRYSQ